MISVVSAGQRNLLFGDDHTVRQVVFVFADCKQTATGTAIDFSKAYFLLETDMEKYMCSELAGDEDESE